MGHALKSIALFVFLAIVYGCLLLSSVFVGVHYLVGVHLDTFAFH